MESYKNYDNVMDLVWIFITTNKLMQVAATLTKTWTTEMWFYKKYHMNLAGFLALEISS